MIIAVNIFSCVNEDSNIGAFGENEFDSIRIQMVDTMKKIGFSNVTFVPICAKKNLNIS